MTINTLGLDLECLVVRRCMMLVGRVVIHIISVCVCFHCSLEQNSNNGNENRRSFVCLRIWDCALNVWTTLAHGDGMLIETLDTRTVCGTGKLYIEGDDKQ